MNVEATQWKRYFAADMPLIFGRQLGCVTRNFVDKKTQCYKGWRTEALCLSRHAKYLITPHPVNRYNIGFQSTCQEVKVLKMYKRCGGVSKIYRCPVCHEIFAVPYQTRGGGRTNWVYSVRQKRRKIYYCSYHCFREMQKMTEGKVEA